MNLKFIGPAKRRWVRLSPRAARAVASLSGVDAQSCFNQGNLTLAFDFAGESLEAARCLLFEHQHTTTKDLRRYMRAALLMSRILRASGMTALIAPFIEKFLIDCETLIALGLEKSAMQACIKAFMAQQEAINQHQGASTAYDGLEHHSDLATIH